MRVRVTDPSSIEPLVGFLEERGCIVDRQGDELQVNPLGSLRYELAVSQLADLLQAWLETHPGTAISLDGRS